MLSKAGYGDLQGCSRDENGCALIDCAGQVDALSLMVMKGLLQREYRGWSQGKMRMVKWKEDGDHNGSMVRAVKDPV